MKLKNVKAGQRVQYKGNISGHSEHTPVGATGTIVEADGSDRPLVKWDGLYNQWTYIGNLRKVK